MSSEPKAEEYGELKGKVERTINSFQRCGCENKENSRGRKGKIKNFSR